MTAPGGANGSSAAWPLRGLVCCGYCDEPMDPATGPDGQRVYECAAPCGRTRACATGLEEMAHRTALAALPSLAEVDAEMDDEVGRRALFAETYRRIVVHDDLTDVRFLGYFT